MATGSLLVGGAMSDAGKFVLTAGICRWLGRQGLRVAPFKAQNMSNNSVVTPDGAEIGRAQAMQESACGVPAEAAMNPVLLKPGSDLTSQIVLMGRAGGAVLQVAVIRLPRISNFTDVDALALEPGVAVRFVTTPAGLHGADLAVLPGSRRRWPTWACSRW